MTDPHEDLVEAALNEFYGPYATWTGAEAGRMRKVIALIAERTKGATDEMLAVAWYGEMTVVNWSRMHRASALWPKEKP